MMKITSLLFFGTAGALLLAFGFCGQANAFENTDSGQMLAIGAGVDIGGVGGGVSIGEEGVGAGAHVGGVGAGAGVGSTDRDRYVHKRAYHSHKHHSTKKHSTKKQTTGKTE